MKWFICDDCGEIFNELEASGRPSTLEDGCEPWRRITCCPVCQGDQISDAEICPLCGKPHAPTDSTFCEGCYNYVSAGLKSMAWIRGEGSDAEKALQELVLYLYKI